MFDQSFQRLLGGKYRITTPALVKNYFAVFKNGSWKVDGLFRVTMNIMGTLRSILSEGDKNRVF